MKNRYRQQARVKREQRDHWNSAPQEPAIDANDTDGEAAADLAEGEFDDVAEVQWGAA